MTVKVGGLTGFPTGADYHLADQVAMMHTGPLSTRSGVVAGLDLVKTSGMGGAITPGQAWVAGTSGSAQGGYPFTVTANEPISFAPGDATRDRIDLVVAHVYENIFDASGQTIGVIEVVQGAYPSSGQPVEPALPANAARLFAQRINAGTSAGSGGFDTALTTDRRPRTAAHGGIAPVDAAERDDLTEGEGLTVWRKDAKRLEVWDATTGLWRPQGIRRTVTAQGGAPSPVLFGTPAPASAQRVEHVIHGVESTSDLGGIAVEFPEPFTTCVEYVAQPVCRDDSLGLWFNPGALSLTQLIIRGFTPASGGGANRVGIVPNVPYTVKVRGV